MSRRRLAALAVAAAVLALPAAAPSPARAIANPLPAICSGAGLISGLLGKGCAAVQHAGRIVRAGGQLLGGRAGGAVKTLLGGAGAATKAVAATAVLAAAGLWAIHGAQAALREAARVIGRATTPHLTATWFSLTYWRVAGLSALLTVPFLFAAAIQALVRSEPALLARAAFGYLPLALLTVSIAAPVTMLLLAASDQMSTVVEGAAGDGGGRFLTLLAGASALGAPFGSTFLALLIGVVIVGAALMLSLELLMREAAVYVVVLMLPLAFAAMVWPARRAWAVRIVELLVALILSKFVIVAVLALAEGALGQLAGDGIGTVLAGMALLLLAAFSPWVLLRLLPFAEVGAGIGGALRGEHERLTRAIGRADAIESALSGSEPEAGDAWIGDRTAEMSRAAAEARDRVEPAATTAPPGRSDARAGAPAPAGPATESAPESGTARGQWLAGDEPHWQQRNGTWPPIPLGPDPEAEE